MPEWWWTDKSEPRGADGQAAVRTGGAGVQLGVGGALGCVARDGHPEQGERGRSVQGRVAARR